MDAIYRYQRYIYDASRKYYLLGRDRLLDELQPPPGGSVLEVACGTGRNLVSAARRYPGARLYGFDISAAMLDTARAAIARRGLDDRIALCLGDATDFSGERAFQVAAFDRVFISYALSMIPPWREVLVRSTTQLSPIGAVHIVDFGQLENLPRAFKTGLYAWLAKFSVHPSAELTAELRRVAVRDHLDLFIAHPLRGYATYAVMRRR
jgi:S-adenosylmethionine-diacylgycerolhomoserine-N-methlytransferase